MAYSAPRKKRKRPRNASGPQFGRPGSGIQKRTPARAPRPASRPPAAPQFAPPKVPTAATSIPYAQQAFSGGTGGYDVSSDPAVQAASGLAAKIRANAQAQALAKRKQAAIEYGDATGVEPLAGFVAPATERFDEEPDLIKFHSVMNVSLCS